MTATGQQSARECLKSATDAVHDAIHRLPLMCQMANGTISHAEYQILTQRLYLYYATVDESIADACQNTGAGALYDYEPRAPMIAQDLVSMGVAVPDLLAGTDPGKARVRYANRANLAGAAYVVEGSLLGAKLIERALPLSIAPPRARTFWQWCAKTGAVRWAMTRAFIEKACHDLTSRQDACKAALSTFCQFHDLISDRDSHSDVRGSVG